MARHLKLMVWNANGVRGQKNDLHLFATDHDIDVILIAETHLKPGTAFNLPAYATYRTDRPGDRTKGGTAALIHRRIVHRQAQLNVAPLEATAIYVDTGDTEILLCAAYVTPSSPLPTAQLSTILDRPGPVIIAGDLNAKHPTWNSRVANPRGRQLYQLTQRRDDTTVMAPTTPTHYPYNNRARPDVLDVLVLKGVEFPVEVSTVNELSSDHLPLIADVHAGPVTKVPIGSHTVRTDWQQFHNSVQEQLPPPTDLETTVALDDCVVTLQRTLQVAINVATHPAEQQRMKKKIPQYIRDEVISRRRLRRIWQRTRHPGDKQRFQAQCVRVKILLNEHSADTWNAYLDGLDIEDGSAWKAAKQLRGTKPVNRPLHGRQGIVYTAEDKAEAFADTMEAQFEPHHDIIDDAHDDMVEEFNENYFEDPPIDSIEPFTHEEVLAEVQKTKARKAPGLDKIGAKALHSSPPALILHLVALFNSILHLHHFPAAWKQAKIILIPKPGKDLLFPQNYRPISLLPVISKIFERLLLKRMMPFLDDFIRPEQFGFRRGHSTTLQLTRVISKLVDARNMNLATAAVFLDVSKAFDKVWHEGLLYKLAGTPLPKAAIHLLRSYLSGRSFRTTVDGALSPSRDIQGGVPQGSVLGPVLYLVYTNDMPTIPRLTLSLYADDAVYHCSSDRPALAAERLQRMLDTLRPWLKKWKVKVNPEKSVAVLFKKYRRMPRAKPPPVTLHGQPIDWQNSAKYLGITLDDKLNFRKHVTAKLVETTRIQGLLQPLLCRRSPLPMAAKARIFTMIVRSVLTYASPAWWALVCTTLKKKVEACQSKALRRITGVPWYVANDVVRTTLGVPPIHDFVRAMAERMFQMAEESGQAHFEELARREGAPEFRLPRPRAILDDPP